jgi:hypothetical protein
MVQKMFVFVSVVLLAATAAVYAEIYSGESSNRVTINLGETPWRFIKADPPTAMTAAFKDSIFPEFGVPYSWADTESFLNEKSGGGDGSMEGGPFWYRKHFTLDNKYADKKIVLQFEGVHVGVQVYFNGSMLPTTSTQNTSATHVLGFTGFANDITDKVNFGGADNVIAARVSKNQGFYSDPGFSLVFRFGQGTPGIVRPVWLHITDKVHVPLNEYSGTKQWGTYVATQTVANDGSSADVKIQTNVLNEGGSSQDVTLITKIVDAKHNVIQSFQATQTIGAGQAYVFDQTATIQNPTLWYPNNSTFGKPYMHKVYHIVKVNGATADVFESPLGIRVITWDKDFPYINGHKHLLFGASARYDYPALATALPREVEWKDAKILSENGGNLWRPGHSPCSAGFVDACDAYGIMLIQPSGEGEGAFSGGGNGTLKQEIHRDMIIRDRNHPSILAWEASNGPINTGLAQALKQISVLWEPVHPRAQADRTPSPANGDILACTLTGCEIGVKNQFPNNPAWGAEAWGRHGARYAYDNEIEFAAEFLQNWHKSIQANCFGLAQWYLAETPGEDSPFLGVAGDERSFGSSMMDFNRIPKLLYKAYAACWIPFSLKPVVYLAHHWNRSGTVRVNAWSNCPSVRLKLNGTDLGSKTPNPWTGTGTGIDGATTQLPFQCWWDGVPWASGTLRAEGLDAVGGNVVCFDEKKTAGAPHHVVLTVDPPLVKPDGDTFFVRANGYDAALILATVVDADGNWCPTDNRLVTFSVTGPGRYVGGTDQQVTAGQPKSYHAPGDHELRFEGGMCKIAVRSQFTPGVVNVSASGAGLPQTDASTSFTVRTLDNNVPVVRQSNPRALMLANGIKFHLTGSGLRYFVENAAALSFDVLNAAGKMVSRVSTGKQAKGWHTIALSGSPASIAPGNGVYFVRLSVNGEFACVQRLLFVR